MTKRKSTQATGTRANTVARDQAAAERVIGMAEPSQTLSGAPAPVRRPTKQSTVIGLLQRKEGATLADLVAATGWLPHTTRAALTRLRQAGHVLEKITGDAGAVYRIASPGRAARPRKAA